MGDTILFRSVQIGSSAVYQCNASNHLGYLLENAFVNILSKAGKAGGLGVYPVGYTWGLGMYSGENCYLGVVMRMEDHCLLAQCAFTYIQCNVMVYHNVSVSHSLSLSSSLSPDIAPRMLGPKNQLIKVIEAKHIFLDCPFFGSPQPQLRW